MAKRVAERVLQKLCGHEWRFSHLHDDGKNLYEVERCARCGKVRINMGPAKFEFPSEREMLAAERSCKRIVTKFVQEMSCSDF